MPRTWVFDDRNQRWRWPNTGRMVPHIRVNRAYERVLADYRRDITRLSERLAADQISPREWQTGMKRLVKDIHLNARSLAVGGSENMTLADFGAVGGRLRQEYEGLAHFGQAIARGQLTPAQIQVRARMYGQGMARRTLHNGRLAGHQRAGFQQKRRVIQSGNPCPTCDEQANLDWVAIDSSDVTGVGEGTICDGMDQCAIDIRYSEESALPPRIAAPGPRLVLVEPGIECAQTVSEAAR